MSFSAFRDRLDRASGFQSLQFREFEFILGYKRKEALAYYADDMPGLDRVRHRLAERSVVDHFYDFVERHGVAIPEVLRNKDPEASTEPNVEVQEGLFKLFTSQPELAILFELMMDFDEGQQEWRYRHVKLVELGERPNQRRLTPPVRYDQMISFRKFSSPKIVSSSTRTR